MVETPGVKWGINPWLSGRFLSDRGVGALNVKRLHNKTHDRNF